MCCVMLKLAMEQDFFFFILNQQVINSNRNLVQGVACYDIKLGAKKKIMGQQLLCSFLPNKLMNRVRILNCGLTLCKKNIKACLH